MCGIIGYNGFEDPKQILLDGLKRLEYRGYDSAGIAILEKGHTAVFRSEGRIQNLENLLLDESFSGSLGIGHTRWATHGAPTEINAHPHRVGAISIVHNGIIENYLEHKEALQKQGRKISSDTDSEIIAHLFDLEIQSGKTLSQAVTRVISRLEGSYAFVVLSEREPDVLIGVRNGAPLLVGLGKNEIFIASDVQAILHRTNRVLYLEDHQYVVCRKQDVELHNYKGDVIPLEVKTIHWSADQLEKAGYKHFMLKEIHEQNLALANTIENNIDHQKGLINIPELSVIQDKLKKLKSISIVACGTARHAALIGQYYLGKFANIPVDVDFGSEFRYRNPVLNPDDLVILISQSGETADTLAALREAKAKGMTTLAICNVRESTLAREADQVVYTNAGPEIGVASTKAFTTQLAILYMLSVEIGFLRNELNLAQAQELTSDLMRLPILVEHTLQLEPQIEKIALEFQTLGFFFYIGRDVNYPIALEGALKLKEISYAHAEGYPAGEIKHGPIALIDSKVATVVLSPQPIPGKEVDSSRAQILYEKLMSNLQEVKSRGGIILTIGSGEDEKLKAQSNYYLGIPKTSWALNPILLSIPMQLLAYHFATQRGADVDKPRNLAKSVTVE